MTPTAEERASRTYEDALAGIDFPNTPLSSAIRKQAARRIERAYHDGAKAEREQIIAALRTKEMALLAARECTITEGLRVVADWLDRNSADKAT